MTPDRALIAAVAAHPKDEAARLACASWFRERGSPRGELIQAQLALQGRLSPAERLSLRRRVEVLATEAWDEWIAPLQQLGATPVGPLKGLVEEVSLTEEALARHGEALVAREPVHRLRLKVRDGEGLARAAASPWFEQVRWLKLSGAVDAGAKALASAAHARQLESLLLAEGSEDVANMLARSEALSGLRSLSLTGVELGPEGLAGFAKTRLTLTRLYLTNTCIDDGGVATLAASTLKSLEWLALNRNEEVSDEGVEALASSKVLVNLQRLELAKTGVSAEGALAFRRPKALPRLQHLDLSGNYISSSEVEPLRKRLGKGLIVQ
jgi:uncharacterized protein (TIGR02996 family)